jgi:hypothetical protein
MALTVDNLVGYLRATYVNSGKLRIWQFILQLLIAVPAAASVVITSSTGSYILAVVGALLLVAWVTVNAWYLSERSAAHTARRAALLVGGLTKPLSAAAILSLQDRMKVSAQTARGFEKADYYATKRAPGAARLAEMIEESAFYSAPLQRASALVMLVILMIFATLAAAVALSAPFIGKDTSLIAIRIVLSVFVFAMSSDVVGAYIAHKNAARSIDEVRARLMTATSGGYPEADILLALTDYNAAVEGAPESVPLAYRLSEKDLNAKWNDYQRNRDAARAATASFASL